MAPVRRREGDPFPVYDEGSESFTVEVIHGGFFVGSGSNRTYVDGTKVCFDNCDCDTWSPLWFEDMIEALGYEAAGRIHVHWLLPGMQINEDGLRLIVGDKDALSMVAKVKQGHKFLMVYLDHDPVRKDAAFDDVVVNRVVNLTPAISPVEQCSAVTNAIVQVHDVQESSVANSGARRRSNRVAAVVEDGDSENGNGSDSDEDYAPDIIDSDNDIEDGDDDLYQQYADQEPKAVKVIPEGEMSEDEFFEPADSDDETNRFKFKSFVPEDMHDPKFHVGQIFQSVDQLRKAVREHSCKHRKNIKFPKNDKTRLNAKCEEPCPWELYASIDSRTKAIMVKRLQDVHTCESKWQVRAFSARYIGKHYVDQIRANEKMTLKGLGQLVQKDWKMTPKRGKLGRARKFAFEIIYGDETAQYNQLWDFGQELRRSNPGSTYFLLLDDAGHFQRCYFSIDACKRGFLAGCRPIIFLDGCHLKTKFGGILLTAIGMDPNDCIFPVAFAIVEVENTSSWKWFLTALKQDLGILNTSSWTIMSDKQKEQYLHSMAFVGQGTKTHEPEIINELLHERACRQREQPQLTPLPDCTFIQENVASHIPVQLTTMSKEENLLRKRNVIAAAKLKAAAERGQIADQAKFDAAMAKLAQEEEQRVEAQEKKKVEALARKLANEEKKKAEREAKQLAAEAKKLAAEQKKKELQQQKLALAEKKRLEQEAKRKATEEAKLALAEKRRLDQIARTRELEEAKLKLQEEARQRASEVQNKRKTGQTSRVSYSYMAPFKIPRKESMFDYLKGPPPGCTAPPESSAPPDSSSDV